MHKVKNDGLWLMEVLFQPAELSKSDKYPLKDPSGTNLNTFFMKLFVQVNMQRSRLFVDMAIRRRTHYS